MMIDYKINIGDSEREALIKINVANNPNKRRILALRIFMIVLAVIILFTAWIEFGTGYIATGIFGLVFGVFAILFASIGAKLVMTRSYSRKMRQNLEAYSGRREYIINEMGVRTISELGDGMHFWNSYKAWGFIGDYLYILDADSQVVLIKKSELTPEEMNELMGCLGGVLQINY